LLFFFLAAAAAFFPAAVYAKCLPATLGIVVSFRAAVPDPNIYVVDGGSNILIGITQKPTTYHANVVVDGLITQQDVDDFDLIGSGGAHDNLHGITYLFAECNYHENSSVLYAGQGTRLMYIDFLMNLLLLLR